MSKELPQCVKEYVEKLPLKRTDRVVAENIKKFTGLYGEDYVESIVWTQEDANLILEKMGIKKDTLFHYFYIHAFELPESYRDNDLYGLVEVYSDFNKSYWEVKFPGIGSDFLQLSSIEGEYSYFYKKDSDEVYGVGFEQMDLMINGTMDPIFGSFYDFVNWYFSDEG